MLVKVLRNSQNIRAYYRLNHRVRCIYCTWNNLFFCRFSDADVKSKITFICDRNQTNRGQPQMQSYGVSDFNSFFMELLFVLFILAWWLLPFKNFVLVFVEKRCRFYIQNKFSMSSAWAGVQLQWFRYYLRPATPNKSNRKLELHNES